VSRALLLTPSRGLGGGIERVAESVEGCLEEGVRRIDLGGADLRSKLSFAVRACVAAVRQRPGVVVCLHVGLLPAALAAAAVGRARLAVFAMGREVWAPMSRWERRLLRRCSHVLAISPFTAEWLARRAALAPDAIVVVPLPVGDRFAEIARRGHRAPAAGVLRLLTVSRVASESRYKSHFAIAEAVARLRAVRWTVIGGGDDLPALRERCTDLGIGAIVELLGRVDDEELHRRYREADVFVLPSVAAPDADPPVGEGFGLVYAEAGAYGMPSIASASGGGSSAFVVDGDTGLTVRGASVPELVAAVERLRDHPELRMRLGENARRRVLAHHLPAHFAAALRDALTPK
jgi:phosphatidylinositol alpha-1,6-mannosyltransferase